MTGYTTTPERGTRLRAAMRFTGNWWVGRSGSDYKLIRDLGAGEFLSIDFRQITANIPGPYLNLNQLGLARVGLPLLSVDDRDGTYDATGWTVVMGTTATQGYGVLTVPGNIATGLLTRFTATAGAGTFSPNDKGRRITIPGASSVGGDLAVLISTVAADGSSVTWGSPNGVVGNYTATVWAAGRWSNDPTKTATWTTPADATRAGARAIRNTTCGLATVDIDGDNTRANWLPTAQSKVDDGSYPASILTTGGGTLAPATRVWDQYSGSTFWDDAVVFADGLTPGAHVVTVKPTGYTHAGGAGSRVYLTGWSYGTGAETPTSPGAEVLSTFSWQTGVSAWERAYRFGPNFAADGTTTNPNLASKPIDFYGRVHGYEDQVSLALTIDGVTTTIPDGTTVAAGSKAVFTQVSKQYHPDNTPALCCDHTTVYTLDSAGLTVEHTDTWRAPATMWGGYPVMLPQSAGFDRYTNSGLFQRVTATTGDGSHRGDGAAWIAVGWQQAGPYAQSVELTAGLASTGAGTQNPAVDRWWLEDRVPIGGVKINKQYMPWTATPQNPVAISNGDVWRWASRYRFRRFTSAAETVLGRI